VPELLNPPLAGQPQVSPDGGRVAFSESILDSEADRVASRVGVVDVVDPAGRVTWVGEGHTPRWSPEGEELAVIRDGGLFLVDLRGGRWRPAFSMQGEVVDCAWASTGRLAVAVRMREPDERGEPVDGLPGRYVTRRLIRVVDPHVGLLWTVEDAWHPRWSADGARLAYLSAGGLWWTAGAQPVRVTGRSVRGFAWSPDGDDLAYLAPASDHPDVNVKLWISSAEVDLTAGWELGVGNPVRGDDPRGTGEPAVLWSSAGRIYAEMAAGGRGPLAWFDPRRSARGRLFEGDYVCLSPSSAGGTLAFVRTDPQNPGEIWAASEVDGVDGVDGVAEPLTRQAQIGLPSVPVRAGAVEGWLTGEGPLLVNIHGGPHYAVGWRFTGEVQRLALHGYSVLTANLRGSQGYGEQFATAIRDDWGARDLADLIAVVDRAGRIENAVLWGVSYGGFLAVLAATRCEPVAVISENGALDRPTGRSPLKEAERIHAPVLLVHAEDDQICPIGHSERMAAVLKDVELVRIPGEGHLMNLAGRPSHRLRRARAIDDFLDRHVPPR